jgi:acyl-coenzyme A thioesterase PaaI-like protein
VSSALQDKHSPAGRCFGCGPKNEQGLRIKSVVEGDTVVCDWTPEDHHLSFPGMMSGGIIGALLDCHSNWTAAHHLMVARGLDQPPCTVTGDFHVKLRRPTPLGPIRMVARVAESKEDRCVIESELFANGEVTARCRGTFVAVKPDHPAYHRW